MPPQNTMGGVPLIVTVSVEIFATLNFNCLARPCNERKPQISKLTWLQIGTVVMGNEWFILVYLINLSSRMIGKSIKPNKLMQLPYAINLFISYYISLSHYFNPGTRL